jgi:hypothetical protein
VSIPSRPISAADILTHLVRAARTDQHRCDARIAQRPCECHLREALSATLRDVIVLAHTFDILRALSGCEAGRIGWRNEEIEIALSRSPVSQLVSSAARFDGISASS